MKAKQMQRIGLLLVLVGLPAAYFAYRQDNRWSSSGGEGPSASTSALGPALPELRSKQGELKRIELARGSERVILERASEGWVLPERSNFLAKQEAVLDLLGGLARLDLAEAKTARPENFEKLGLVAPADGGTSALAVRLSDSAGAELGALLLGERAMDRGFQAVYVRRVGENQSYLAKGEVKGGAALRDYLARDLVTWSTERPEALAVHFPEAPEQDYNVSRASDSETNFSLTAMPPGKEASSPYLISAAARTVGGLRCDDVAKQGESSAPDLSAARRVELTWTSFDGLALKLEGFELPAESEFGPKPVWATLSAEVLPWAGVESQNVPAPETADGAAEGETKAPDADAAAEAAGDAEAKPKLTREDLEREAQELNRRLSGWLFKLESSTATSLMRGQSELVKDPTPPPTPGDETGAPLDLSGVDMSGIDLQSLGMSQSDLEAALKQLGNPPAPGATPLEPQVPTPGGTGTPPAPEPSPGAGPETPAPTPAPQPPPGTTPPNATPPSTGGP